LHYDPIKLRLASLLKTPILRRLFHLALDLLFLRAWYVRRELKRISDFGFRISDLENNLHPTKIPHSAIRNPKFLDAGMGFGQYSDRLCRMFPGAKLVGLEIDHAHLYGCEDFFHRVHTEARIIIGDVQRLPLEGNSFDLILTVDVMEHIDDDRAAFAEFYRVLKPGGALVMHTPRVRVKGERIRDKGEEIRDEDTPPSSPPLAGGNKRSWEVGEHVRDGYRDSEARERLERAGFTIERIIRGYGRWGMVAWTLLQRVPLTMLGKSRWLALVAALYLLPALPIGLLAMWLDIRGGDHPDGGSLMVTALKTK